MRELVRHNGLRLNCKLREESRLSGWQNVRERQVLSAEPTKSIATRTGDVSARHLNAVSNRGLLFYEFDTRGTFWNWAVSNFSASRI